MFELQGQMPASARRGSHARQREASYSDYADILDAGRARVRPASPRADNQRHQFFGIWDAYAVLEQRVVPQLWKGPMPPTHLERGRSSGEERIPSAPHAQHAETTGTLERLDNVSMSEPTLTATASATPSAHSTVTVRWAIRRSLSARKLPSDGGLHTVLPEVKRLVKFEQADLLQAPPRSREAPHSLPERHHLFRA